MLLLRSSGLEDLVSHESLFPAIDLVEVLPVGAVNADHLVFCLAPGRMPLLLEILLLREDPNLVADLDILVFPLLDTSNIIRLVSSGRLPRPRRKASREASPYC